MKIAYGTYAMPKHTLEDAIPILANIGYDGVEICAGPRHVGSLPDAMTPSRRAAIRTLLADHDMGVPATFATALHVHETDDAKHAANFEFARELNALPLERSPYGAEKLTTVAADALTSEEKKLQYRLVRARPTLPPSSQTSAATCDLTTTPWTVPVPSRTTRNEDGSLDLLLLGQGELDTTGYVRAMHEAGWDDFITLEVSGMVWNKPAYLPVAAAEFAYATLDGAFREAGVPRG